jgi:hypothetical protein
MRDHHLGKHQVCGTELSIFAHHVVGMIFVDYDCGAAGKKQGCEEKGCDN